MAVGTAGLTMQSELREILSEKERLFHEFPVGSIPTRQAEALVLLAFGLSDPDAGKALGIKADTFRKLAGKARDRVVPAEYEPTRANAQLWASEHLSDCLSHGYVEIFGRPRNATAES
jgi:hypothetical protein